MKWLKLAFIMIIVFTSITLDETYAQRVQPEEVGLSADRLETVHSLIGEAIANQEFPGAVLLVAKDGKVVLRRAYGDAQLIPAKAPMKTDMIFDLASITKPVATATSAMILVEQGKLRLMDEVRKYVPEFSTFVHSDSSRGQNARLWHLLTHTSGLPPYTNASEVARKYGTPCPIDSLVKHIARLPKSAEPGKDFDYSCLGFITLAYIIKQVSGQSIAEFSSEMIFKPLNMTSTFYTPQKEFLERCVPTELVDGVPLIGVVHDPLARLISGVSGNAGLFSTADDLFIFAQMLLNRGVSQDGVSILSPLTVDRMTEVHPAVEFSGRGLGWDLNSAYATNGGDLFGDRSYGHTGYTGTSIWIDPETKTIVIFLTNRVHPDDKGSVVSIRSKVANIIASSIKK
ncbi:serine hydrolase [candidate division KSB1 bacterium]|nr:serine hydrolase [candidate division KSB1 bacterium]